MRDLRLGRLDAREKHTNQYETIKKITRENIMEQPNDLLRKPSSPSPITTGRVRVSPNIAPPANTNST